MNTRFVLKAAFFALLASSAACNRAESPAKTASDVSKARQEAVTNLASAQHKAADDLGKAAAEAAQARYDVAIAGAKGDHKVAVEQCEVLSGDQQKSCKDKADADLELATARAKDALTRAKM